MLLPSKKFKRIDKPNDRKLKYQGFCPNCNKDTHHRFYGGNEREDLYECMNCKTINSDEREYVSSKVFYESAKEQLLHFAEWLVYNGKFKTPSEQVEHFIKEQTK